jgi:EAL domain-containing protein (putative c-di-GMP-specific phosphodiesterase class I)
MQVVKAAEDSGLIGPLGNWVLLNACAQGQQWRDQGSASLQLRVAVNLSFRQFIQQNLVEQITDVLAQTGLPAQCLELQLTESVAISDPERVVQQLQHLHQMGVHLALDNFGRGHASLLYLRDLPIDQLRIDRSFLDSTQDPYQWTRNQALLKAMIDMGHSLGLTIAASGVEHSQQLQVLQQLGCDQAQGHYFSPPLSIEQFGHLVMDPSAGQFILDCPMPTPATQPASATGIPTVIQ